MKTKITTIFVSGHLDLTQEEFESHYLPLLSVYTEQQCNFVIGDAKGTDTLTQQFLANIKYPQDKITIFHMKTRPRNLVQPCNTVGGFQTDEQRDKQMTLESDIDLAHVRPDRLKSGTARNVIRRITINNKIKELISDITIVHDERYKTINIIED